MLSPHQTTSIPTSSIGLLLIVRSLAINDPITCPSPVGESSKAMTDENQYVSWDVVDFALFFFDNRLEQSNLHQVTKQQEQSSDEYLQQDEETP